MKIKQRVFVMEGPDRCGKTEIGGVLARYYGAPYFKVSSEVSNWKKKDGFKLALEYDQTYISEFLEQTKLSCTIDRAYPSEWVYSQIYERTTNLNVLLDVDKRFATMGAIIILCTRKYPPAQWDDDLVDLQNFDKIKKKYVEFANWTKCNIVKMNVDSYDCSIDKQLPLLVDSITMCETSKQSKVVIEL